MGAGTETGTRVGTGTSAAELAIRSELWGQGKQLLTHGGKQVFLAFRHAKQYLLELLELFFLHNQAETLVPDGCAQEV